MLDLMLQNKMSRRKKKIIKVYGKDMLAEMYLDLLNVTEGRAIPKRILSPLSGKFPRGLRNVKSKKNKWNNDSTLPVTNNFKLNSMSIFNVPNAKGTHWSGSKDQNITKKACQGRNNSNLKENTTKILNREGNKYSSSFHGKNKRGVKLKSR